MKPLHRSLSFTFLPLKPPPLLIRPNKQRVLFDIPFFRFNSLQLPNRFHSLREMHIP